MFSIKMATHVEQVLWKCQLVTHCGKQMLSSGDLSDWCTVIIRQVNQRLTKQIPVNQEA